MKHLKHKQLYEKNGLLRKDSVPMLYPEDLEQWLRTNITDSEIRQWYRQKLADADCTIPRKLESQ